MNIANIKRYAMRDKELEPMAQQTAVEWLVERIKSDQNQKALSASEWMKAIEQAKQMEKEQINKAFYDGYYEEKLYDARNYYTDTYSK